MGKEKERAEQVATVRAVLGDGTLEMDIIRALHMASDDPTKVINILLDFHHRPPPPTAKPTKAPAESIPTPKTPAQSKPAAEKPRPTGPTLAPASTPTGGENWWLVGSADMAGLSICKGRRIASGDPVTFSFPNSAAATSSRARAVPAAPPSLPAPPRLCASQPRTTGRWVASPTSGRGAPVPAPPCQGGQDKSRGPVQIRSRGA